MTAGQGVAEASPYSALNQLTASRIRRRLQRGKGPIADWHQRLTEDERERLRPLGRRLVTLASEYLTKGSRRARVSEEVREIGAEYGRRLLADGFTLRDAIEGFTFFRKSLDDSVIELSQRNTMSTEDAVEVWEHLSALADQVLIAIAESYEEEAGALAAASSN